MKWAGVFGLCLATLLAGGCGRFRYSYAPVTTTSAVMEGVPAAVVTMPADGAKGELRIASLGVANVTPPPRVGVAPFRSLFVRFVVVNDSAEPWTFDQAEQRIELEAGPNRQTTWARTATGDRPPTVPVPPHGSASFDLLFPVGARDEGDLARFAVQWSLRQGTRLLAGRVEFARHLETREPAPAAFEPGAPPPYRSPDRTTMPTPDPCLP